MSEFGHGFFVNFDIVVPGELFGVVVETNWEGQTFDVLDGSCPLFIVVSKHFVHHVL